ncbi:MAG TPA: AAA family ATPase, partial [Gemmatimonadales bacterium]|nr:AAA family ATPase [Gemmatimonadales bacterium]
MPGGLDAYLPVDRRQAIIAGGTLPDRAHGAALFADVSGFTALTGALEAELGRKRGAEELLRHINRVYDHLVAEVHSKAGSVVGFAGDSITCWFDDRPEGVAGTAPAAHRALSAALGMQAGMSTVAVAETPSGARVSLGIKVAITAGPARRFAVGDPGRFLMDTLAGRTLDRMAAAERLAAVHEIVVGPEVVQAIGGALEVRSWRPAADPGHEGVAVVGGLRIEVPATPWPALPAGAWTETLARPWILPAVYERLRGGGAFLGELRPAVPMFVSFEGIAYDEEERAGTRLDQYVRWAQETLGRYEGSIIQLTIGDKGSNLYATFGAPIAHEDDVERAFAASLDLHARPPDLDFIGPVRIGVSQGQVWTGACGSESRRCYGVMGHPVNLAARLMGRAEPGQTLVEERLARSAAAKFETRSQGEATLKGRKDTVATALVTGRRAAAGSSRPASADRELVGRTQELRALTAELEPVVRGERRLVLLEGEAGIGKSRLAAALVEAARGDGMIALTGGADSVERSRAYHAWRSVFSALFGLDPGLEQEAARTRVLARLDALDPALARRAALLNAVLPLQLPDDPFVAQMDGSVRAQNTRELLVRLLVELTAAPFLLVLEDAHWFDSASWALLGALRRRSDPSLLVLVSRPLDALGGAEAVPAEFREFVESPETLRIRLEPLTAADAVALASRRLGVDELPGSLVRLIGERAEGNPFFIEEMVQAMREAGLLAIVDGRCMLRPGSGTGGAAFPDTLEGLITSRIDRLDPLDQRTAKVASVIGRIFPYRTLEAVFPIIEERPRLRGSLEHLERMDITPVHQPEPELAHI